MTRRDFILSCVFMAVGSVLTKTVPFLRIGNRLFHNVPEPAGNSPIPEKNIGIVENIRNGGILLTDSSHNCIKLNDEGSIIWNNIDGNVTCNHISALLSNKFDIDFNRASKDVESFIFSLEKEGFVRIRKVGWCYARKRVIYKGKPYRGKKVRCE